MTDARTQAGRLLYLTQWFPPEPVAIPLWVAEALRRHGWDIEVVTGYPNYPDGNVHEGYSPHRFGTGVQDGLPVTRTPLYASHDASAARRMLNYLSWALSACFVTPWRSRKKGVTLVYSSPATAALPAMLARLLVRRPFVLLVQDIWPDSVTSSGFIGSSRLMRMVEGLLHTFVNASYRLAEAVVVISPGAVGLLEQRGVPPEKLHVVHNWADETVMRPTSPSRDLRRELGIYDDAFLLMYAGTMGPAQSLQSAVRAVGMTRHPSTLVMVGQGVDREGLEALAADVSPGRVLFLDPVPIDQVAGLMAGADAQLISLASDPLFETTMPSKVQSLLACGSLTIASAPGDAAQVVRDAGGFAVRPDDEGALAEAIDQAASLDRTTRDRLRSQAFEYYQDHLSEQAGAGRLSRILSRALHHGKGQAR